MPHTTGLAFRPRVLGKVLGGSAADYFFLCLFGFVVCLVWLWGPCLFVGPATPYLTIQLLLCARLAGCPAASRGRIILREFAKTCTDLIHIKRGCLKINFKAPTLNMNQIGSNFCKSLGAHYFMGAAGLPGRQATAQPRSWQPRAGQQRSGAVVSVLGS